MMDDGLRERIDGYEEGWARTSKKRRDIDRVGVIKSYQDMMMDRNAQVGGER